MKISLATFTEEQLKEYTTKVITEQNNAFCAETGEKPTIRFSTKPAAIKKCLINQKLYVEQVDKKAEEFQHKITNELVTNKEVKEPKQKTTEAKSKIILAADEPKATVVYYKLWELVSTSLDEINRKELGKVFAEEQNILETSAQWYISKAIVNGILKVKE